MLIGGGSVSLDKLEKTVQEHVELIKMSRDSFKDPLDRATKFLVVRAFIADHKRQLEIDKAKLEAITEALFAAAVEKAEGKGITEKKIAAASNEEYKEAKDTLTHLEAMVSWCRTMDAIFADAHVTYRQLAKE